MLGVCVGTAAMLVVLSVFNGMQMLTIKLHAAHNPALKVSSANSKTFKAEPALKNVIKQTEGVLHITEAIEDNALVRFNETNLAVRMKGVEDNYDKQYNLKPHLLRGELTLNDPKNGLYYAILGAGVMLNLNAPLAEPAYPLIFWYPKRGTKQTLDPSKAFRQSSIIPIGVVSVEQQFDMNTVLVPLDFVRELTQYEPDAVTQLELALAEQIEPDKVKKILQEKLGKKFVVETAIEQQESVLRAFRIERLFAYIALAFVMVVASFNIFFSLSMLVIEKKRDIAMLSAMGSPAKTIKQIFWWESFLVGSFGVFLGYLLGFGLVYAQQEYGWVSMGVASAVQEAYPVEMKFIDFIYVGLTVLTITTLAGVLPAQKAGRLAESRYSQL